LDAEGRVHNQECLTLALSIQDLDQKNDAPLDGNNITTFNLSLMNLGFAILEYGHDVFSYMVV